ncbi:hypothetical protein KAR91_70015 [Candidatus Pacearchaeota archaeon]|nr:hypothetical protein [Candidatus Pacearchaeota archaeon]
MHNKISIAVAIFLLFPILFLLSQSRIRIEDANRIQADIAMWKEKNQFLQEEVDNLTQEKAVLQASVKKWENDLVEIEHLIKETQDRISELDAILEQAADKNFRDLVLKRSFQCQRILEGLAKRQKELKDSIALTRKKIDENNWTIKYHTFTITKYKEYITELKDPSLIAHHLACQFDGIDESIVELSRKASKYLKD